MICARGGIGSLPLPATEPNSVDWIPPLTGKGNPLHGKTAMDNSEDRRRHTRFDMSKVPCDLWLIAAGDKGSRLERCTLLNLSFGGMCFSFPRSLDPKRSFPFQLKLSDLDPEPFSVQAEIRWSRQADEPGWVIGAEFRESTKGWVGPDELMD